MPCPMKKYTFSALGSQQQHVMINSSERTIGMTHGTRSCRYAGTGTHICKSGKVGKLIVLLCLEAALKKERGRLQKERGFCSSPSMVHSRVCHCHRIFRDTGRVAKFKTLPSSPLRGI